MARLNLYKPNSKNTGASFSANFKGPDLFFTIVKQASWNEQLRRASFKENAKHPQKSLAVKISPIEAANIILAIDTKGQYSSYHKSKNQNLNISFEIMMDKKTNTEKGFYLRILKEDTGNSVDKISFAMGFYFAEAVILKAFLDEFIRSSFFSQDNSAEQEAPASQSSLTQKPPAQPLPVKEVKKTEPQDDDW